MLIRWLQSIAILKELREELLIPMRMNGQVRSMLTLVRKVIDEHEKSDRERFKKLKFFCNWGLHNQLSQSDTTLDLFLSAYDLPDHSIGLEEYLTTRWMNEILPMKMFRDEFKDFLNRYGLPDELPRLAKYWLNFVDLFAGAVSESPLTFSKKANPTTPIRKLMIRKVPQPEGLQATVQWEFLLVTGEYCRWEHMYDITARTEE